MRPEFKFKVLIEGSPPPADDWDHSYQISYDVPVSQNRSVSASVNVFKGVAYIMLIDGSNATLAKRGAQIMLVSDTWRPQGLKKEDLSHSKAKTFSKADA